MTKQEEINKWVDSFLKTFAHDCEPYCANDLNEFGEIGENRKELLAYLDSQGVVIETKTDWCPAHGYPLPCYKCGAPKGIKVYEPLIHTE